MNSEVQIPSDSSGACSSFLAEGGEEPTSDHANYMSSWEVCVLGSSLKQTVNLKTRDVPTVVDLKREICRQLVQSSGRFFSLQPYFIELVVDTSAVEVAEQRLVMDEAFDNMELQQMPGGLITVIPVDWSRDAAWRPIRSGVNDNPTGLELRAIELGGSLYNNCFFYSFIAALEEYIKGEQRPALVMRVSGLVAETNEFLESLPELPEEEMTLDILHAFRKDNSALNVESEFFNGIVSVWNLRDLVAHRLPDFLHTLFFREGACKPEENFCRWGLHAPAKETLADSIRWFQWRMRFPWGVYPDAAKLLADLLQIPVSLYETRVSKGVHYCICTTTHIDGMDLKETSNDARFGSGMKLLGMSGHWQLAQVRTKK